MKFLRRYYLLEIFFGLVAIVSLGMGFYSLNAAPTPVAIQPGQALPTPTLVSTETEIALVQEVSNAIPAEGFDEEGEDDEDFSEDDEDSFDEDDFSLVTLAANTLQVDEETLERDLLNGRTLADIAAERGADAETLTALLVEAEQTHIDQLAANGSIDMEEADFWKAEVAVLTPFYVTNGYHDAEVVAARALDMDVEEFYESLESGQTAQSLAEQSGIAVETIVEAIVSAENKLIDHLITIDFIDSAEAREWRTEHQQFARNFVAGNYE